MEDRRLAHAPRPLPAPGSTAGATGGNGSEAGVTLLELLIALVMMTVGVLALAQILLGTSERQQIVESHSEVTAAARAKLEQLRNTAAAGTADTVQLSVGGSLTSDVVDHADSVQTPEGRWYARRWAVTVGPAGTRQVTLRVISGDDDKAVDSRDFVTLIDMGS